ncbi:hypothetical protein [Jiangella anatolica]|uniref:Uncharacterized protein n=1 Tax=Jiangella anatolica TaxID=2670374 RepID=A0A2W2B9C9_9ACTN|nr:hypothetical protein [Jiangella anatolica]PZF84151.1 hypothetical protein C1I92_09890 [Jiangella anatolica]
MVAPDITEGLPTPLGGRTNPQSAIYRVTRDAFDVAIGDLPFNLYASVDHPYERSSAQMRKDQFDASRLVGEQSLDEWWLRSQTDFSGGDGITYYEPLEGEGSETRFYDSRGVNVFDFPEVRLLNEQATVFAGGADLEFVGIGEPGGLFRTGNSFRIIGENGSVTAVTPFGTTPRGIARVPGHNWLVGHSTGIGRLSSTGVAQSLWTGATGAMTPYWAKDRIWAVQGTKIYQLTLAGGAVVDGTHLFYTHPSTSWDWISIVETGSAAWMAGRQGAYSTVYVTTVEDTDAGPEFTQPAVALRMPAGEYVTAMQSYLDFLLICTNLGFRVAITDGDRAQLGPLIWDDQGSFSASARGEYAYVGLANGLTRRVALGIVTSPDELQFAWANDAEVPGGGNVTAVGFVGSKLTLAVNDIGCSLQSGNLVQSGYLTTGFVRFGTMEPKYFAAAKIVGDVTNGSIGIAGATTIDAYSEITDVANFNGSTEVALNLPGAQSPWEKLSLRFTFQRDSSTLSLGPKLDGYQLRALPAPSRRQELISLPLMCKDRETVASGGTSLGGDGFAYARFSDLKALERTGVPFVYQDFRTGEARSVTIEQVLFVGQDPPDRNQKNFGGVLQVTLRTAD